MRVLHVINSLISGGAEKLLLDTVPLYQKKGLNVDVLLLNGNKYPFYFKLEALQCCDIFSLNVKSLYNPLVIFKILRYFKNYDIVHVHLFPAQYWVVLAKILSLSKVKIVTTEHCTINRRRESIFFRFLDRYIYKGFDKIVCISQEIQDIVFKHTGLRKNLLPVIQNGVDLDAIFCAIPVAKETIVTSLCTDDVLLIQVSAFRDQKDQETLIRAMKLLPNEFKLILVGDGITKSRCQEIVSNFDLNARVFFLNLRSDVLSLLKSSDIVVLSTKYEGLSLSCIEGLASGKPFIGSDVPGMREVVQGAGLLFEQGNFRELSNHIMKLANDMDYSKKISEQCIERAQNYSINSMVDSHIEMYKSLV